MAHRLYDPAEQVTGTCTLSTYAPDKNGYSLMWSGTKYVKHHRHVYCKANNILPASIVGKTIMHICDNPSCVNADHLRLGTGALNMLDKTLKGRNNAPVGTAHGMAKLTAEAVIEIRANAHLGAVMLAARYGITHQTVSKILLRQRWKHVL